MQRTAAARWACALVSNASPATLRAALPAQAWRAAAAPAWSRSMVAAQGRVNHLVRKGELEAPPHPHESQMPDKKTLINAQAAYRKVGRAALPAAPPGRCHAFRNFFA